MTSLLLKVNKSWQRSAARFIYNSKIMSSNGSTEVKPQQSYQGNVKSQPRANVEFFVDLRSDTVTRPGKEMREMIANAVVGDDVMGEDPTVSELENRMAKKLGKEAALFVTAGSMGNLIAVLVHCTQRGAEAIVGDHQHMFRYEQGSMAQFGGVQVNTIPNESDGTYSIDKVIENIRPDDIHYTKTSLICVENTHNMCGGRVLPMKWLDEISQVAHKHGIPIHMDGARLFNASIASGIPASRIVRDVDSVSICLSKGLGAPVGGLVLGTKSFIAQARRMRKALGGGMRQSGILAAAGLYCMDHMVDRLADDHGNAKIIAKAIHSLGSPIVSVEIGKVETNILLLNVTAGMADEICERFAEITPDEELTLGSSIQVLSSPRNDAQIRLVTHCDVSKEMAVKAAEKICFVIKELASRK